MAGGVLTVTSDAGDAIEVTCAGTALQVNGANPGTGPATCAAITSIVVTGGPGANAIDLAGVTTVAFPAVTAVTVDGAAGNDTITGTEHADTINGGVDNDRILGEDNAAGTRDLFRGDAGDDTLVWNPGDDDDTMDGGAGVDTIEVNGGGAEQFTVRPSAAAGRVAFDRINPAPFNLDIGTSERLDFNAGAGDDSLVSDNGLAALGFRLDLDGGDGNDTLDGADGPDLLAGGVGNDRLIGDDNAAGTRDVHQGQAGDDTLVWNPGDGDDTMDGGDGADTIEVNGGGGGEQFTVKPSATAGRVAFDRTGPTPPGPFNLDIGTSERLDLNAGGGDDSLVSDNGLATLGLRLDIDGGDGNDTLDGADGADLLAGGAGNDRLIGDDNAAGTRDVHQGQAGDDTMVWNPGDGDDTMDGGDGTDTVEVNGGTGGEQFTARPSATAGRVAFDRTGPTPPGPFNLDIGTSERLDLNAGGGNDRFRAARGLAASGFALDVDGGSGSDAIGGGDGEDVLTGGTGNDVIDSRDRAEDRVDCASGFDVARVDRRDFLRGCNIVLGGARRARVVGGAVEVAGRVAPVRVRCIATSRCRVTVQLRRGDRRLGTARASIARQRTRTVRVRLNARGRRLVARAPRRGLRVTVRLDVRDADANGWRRTQRLRLRR